MISAENLACIRGHRKLFKSISFALKAGELLLVEGENGSGKSSLLRLLSGIASPLRGDIYWQGQSIYSSDTTFADYRDALHYLGHQNGLKLGLTVIENLRMTEHLLQMNHFTTIDETILKRFQLQRHAHVIAEHLSAGQKRRLALLKCFLFPRPIWIFDEPITSLDHDSQTLFLAELKQHLQSGGLAIVSSHNSNIYADVALQILGLSQC